MTMTVEGTSGKGEKVSSSSVFSDFANEFVKDEPKFGLWKF